ncbi:MAG: thermonuclease family protein [Alphaproteobacteria bacterium]|nr:thermonuclease family protein [Alphaproteobacteria bacterium]
MKLNLCFGIISVVLYALSVQAETVRVADGDSLEIGERRIRLDGIDAPEFTQICQTSDGKNYNCGIEALHYLESLTAGKDINCRCLPEKDRYHRELCECFADNLSLNKAMTEAGWAVAYRDKTYLPAEKSAKQNKRGIWQGKNMRPAIYRILHEAEQQTKTAP